MHVAGRARGAAPRPLSPRAAPSVAHAPRGTRLARRASGNGNGAAANGASYNGASMNGASRSDAGTIEMYVASADDLEDLYNSHSLSVPPPRNAAPASFGANARDVQMEPTAWADPAEVKIMKAELSLTNAELRTVSTELERSNKTARERARELVLLRAALAERDSRLRSAKSELLTTHAALKDKDAELAASYRQLLASAQERGALRQQLLDTQRELQGLRAELETWSQEGRIDGDESDAAAAAAAAAAQSPATPQPGSRAETVAKMLAKLSALSRQVADDAQADEFAVTEAQQFCEE